jgi:hypothetical protein
VRLALAENAAPTASYTSDEGPLPW